MAAKMKCPECGTVCKEKDDHGKTCTGEYIVHDLDDGRHLECLACNRVSPVSEWDWDW